VDDERRGDAEMRAAELTASILASRLGSATARPGVVEARETAAYFRILLGEVRRALGLPDIIDSQESQEPPEQLAALEPPEQLEAQEGPAAEATGA